MMLLMVNSITVWMSNRNLGLVIMANGTYLDRDQILDLAASLEW